MQKKNEIYRLVSENCTITLAEVNEGIGSHIHSYDMKRNEEFTSLDELVERMNLITDHDGQFTDYESCEQEDNTTHLYIDVLSKYFAHGIYMRANENDIRLWRQGHVELYNCEYCFVVERIVKLKLTDQDEKESLFSILGNALNPNH